MPTYDPQKVSISVAGNTIGGFAAGTFIKAERAEDGFTLTIGADGTGCRTKNANKSGSVEITLRQDSSSNDVLSALAALDELSGTGVGSVQIKDGSGTMLCSAQSAWVRKIPAAERGKELGDVTWILDTDKLNVFIGGNTQTPPP